MLHILGAYAYDANDESKPAALFVGTSSGNNMVQEGVKEGNNCPVLVRANRVWIIQDQRHSSALCLSRRMPSQVEMYHNEDTFVPIFNSLLISWRRGADVSSLIYFRELFYPRQIPGTLDLSIPCALMMENHLCLEFLSQLSEEMTFPLICDDDL